MSDPKDYLFSSETYIEEIEKALAEAVQLLDAADKELSGSVSGGISTQLDDKITAFKAKVKEIIE